MKTLATFFTYDQPGPTATKSRLVGLRRTLANILEGIHQRLPHIFADVNLLSLHTQGDTMSRKALFYNDSTSDQRVFIYLAFDSKASDFRILKGLRKDNEYAEETLTIPEFLDGATDSERSSLMSFITTSLSQ